MKYYVEFIEGEIIRSWQTVDARTPLLAAATRAGMQPITPGRVESGWLRVTPVGLMRSYEFSYPPTVQ